MAHKVLRIAVFGEGALFKTLSVVLAHDVPDMELVELDGGKIGTMMFALRNTHPDVFIALGDPESNYDDATAALFAGIPVVTTCGIAPDALRELAVNKKTGCRIITANSTTTEIIAAIRDVVANQNFAYA